MTARSGRQKASSESIVDTASRYVSFPQLVGPRPRNKAQRVPRGALCRRYEAPRDRARAPRCSNLNEMPALRPVYFYFPA